MLSLKPVDFTLIAQWMQDYQRKSRNYEMPPDDADSIGIYRGEELIGYFLVITYDKVTLEINQGYLKQEARHKNLSAISMKLLEELAKKAGYKKIALCTGRAVNSYIKFMAGMGYGLTKAIFEKDLGD